MRENDSKKLREIADGIMDLTVFFSRRVVRRAPHPGGKKFDPSRFVLKTVEELGPLRMSEIGRHMEISKPYMTMLVDKLINEGLVERVMDPSDRRVVKIRITPAGKGVLGDFKKAVRETIIGRLSSLGPEDISSLRDSIEDIRSVIFKLDQEKTRKVEP